jgi:prepilin-type N-terminal cleavage/methylation domain-containing protein
MKVYAKMGKKDTNRGFTLIELLIVVGIIGVLVGILIPVFQGAMQKAKQKSTMVDIGNVAKAVMSYMSDMGVAPPSPEGNLTTDSEMFTALAPFHFVSFTNRDQWGREFQCWTGLGCAGHFGIDGAEVGKDDFVIQSFGRDGEDEGYTFDRTSPDNNFYVMQSMDDFNKDLILWNGNWIRAPRHSAMRL